MSTTPRVAPAGSRRFFVTVLCFAIANAAVWVGYHRWQIAHRHSHLEVIQFAPGDGSTINSPRQMLAWSFNLDVAPASAKNAPPPGQLTPPVPGRWQWTSPRTLTFTPDADYQRTTAYVATLSPAALRTPDGFGLSAPYMASIQTPALALESISQSAFDEHDRIVVELTFSDKVVPSEVQKHLRLVGSDGRDVPFHPHGDAVGRRVRVITDAVSHLFGGQSAPFLDVRVARGLTGQSGPLGLTADRSERLQIATDLVATSASASFPSHDDASLQVQFNSSDLDVEALRQVVSVAPAVPFTLAASYSTLYLHGAFQSGTRYAITFAKPPAGLARKHLPRPTMLSAFVPDRQPSAWFESEFGYLGAEGNRTLLAHVVNLTDVRVTVTRVYDGNLVGWRNAAQRGSYWRNDTDAYARPLAVRDLRIAGHRNEKQDVPLSLDDLLPAGAARDGVYQVSIAPAPQNAPPPRTGSWNEDEDQAADEALGSFGYRYGGASTVVTLSDIGLTARAGRDGVTVWATSLRTARPLDGVHVRLYSSKNQLLGEETTHADGLAKIVPLPAGPGERPAVVIAERSGEALALGDASEINHDVIAAAVEQKASAPAARGRGLTWLDLHAGETNFGDADIGGRAYLRNGCDAFVYTDRGVYRPGETVHLRAIVRGPGNAMPGRFPVRWQIRRPDLRDLTAHGAELDADGAASLDLPLPSDLPAGRWTAHIGLPGESGASARFFGSIAFDVEDFVPQRMKVSVNIDGVAAAPKTAASATDRIALGDDPIVARVQADYLFGRPVAERPATLVARADPVAFAPAAFRGWTFGDDASASEALGHGKLLGRRAELEEIELDQSGKASWDVDVAELIEKGDIQGQEPAAPKPTRAHARGARRAVRAAGATPAANDASQEYMGPYRLTLSGSVTETGGRAITATRTVDVDRVPYYVGLRARETAMRPGVASSFDVRLVAPDGAQAAVVDAALDVSLYREDWNSSYVYENGHYTYHSTLILEPLAAAAKRVEIAHGRGEIAITPPGGGSYVLVARDKKTRLLTSTRFYAALGAWDDNISRQNPERLEVAVQPLADGGLLDAALDVVEAGDVGAIFALADRAATLPPRATLGVGQAAQVIVRSPFAGQLLLSVETDGVVRSTVLDMPAKSIAVPIELTEAMRPNAFITATVLRPVDPNAKWTIHRATGVARLSVDNSDRKLTVELATPAEIRPATSLSMPLRVLDATGQPVAGAAVTVAAVDEGICQLTNFNTPDPFGFFFGHRALGVRGADVYGQLMPEVAKALKQSAVGGDDSALGLHRASPVGAKRVKPVALVSAVLHTDGQGLAHADFSVPEFSGQLRIMAVASEAERFGSSDAHVTVRSPLLVQSSWPRFATPGDRFTVPLTLFNNSPTGGNATVTLEFAGDASPLRFAEGKSLKLTLPSIAMKAGGQATVTFDVLALDRVGVARARLLARMGDQAFEEGIELPIRPPSPTVAAGGYLVAKPGAPAVTEVPAGFLDGTIKYELRAASIPQLQLPEGLDYLDRYPYGCVEQTTSTLFPLAYLSDIGAQLAPGMFDKERVTDKVQVGITRLLSMQTADGGLAMWPGGSPAWPWGTVYATHFLVEAHAAGFSVPEDFRAQLLAYLHAQLARPEDAPETIELQAYAAYVLALAGKPERPVMSRLSELVKASDTGSARLHLAAAWLAAGRRDLASGLLPQALPAPRSARELSGNVGSPVRDPALLVSTLLAVDPDDARIPDLAQQLADAGRNHQWRSTQDTAFAVMALGRYLRHATAQVPYESVELLLDGKPVASADEGKPLVWTAASLDAEMTGERATAGAAKLPAAGAKLEVRVAGAAGAAAHVAWLQTGVGLKAPPDVDGGMKVRRRYLDEHGKPLDALRVRSGDLVQVQLTIEAATAMEYVVLEDLLPAGLEIENPRLEGNAANVAVRPVAPEDATRPREWRNLLANDPQPPVFVPVRTDMRDDRLILVGNQVRAGMGVYVYTARAVAPGTFVLGPVKAECMYDSAIMSLSGGGTFTVLPAGNVRDAKVAEVGGD